MFAVIKLINHKLHILFDGEELLEDEKDENGGRDESVREEAISPSSINVHPEQITDDSESLKNKESGGDEKDAGPSLKTDDSSHVSLSPGEIKEIINTAFSEQIGQEQAETLNDSSKFKCDSDGIDKEKEHSNTELVTSSPTCSPAEKAVVVDLHSTKVVFNEKETKSKG